MACENCAMMAAGAASRTPGSLATTSDPAAKSSVKAATIDFIAVPPNALHYAIDVPAVFHCVVQIPEPSRPTLTGFRDATRPLAQTGARPACRGSLRGAPRSAVCRNPGTASARRGKPSDLLTIPSGEPFAN